jgi:hypothetical protein
LPQKNSPKYNLQILHPMEPQKFETAGRQVPTPNLQSFTPELDHPGGYLCGAAAKRAAERRCRGTVGQNNDGRIELSDLRRLAPKMGAFI